MQRVLLTPGPVELPDPVRLAGGNPMISHREPAFSVLYRELLEKLARLFETSDPVLPVPGSGTGGLDALCQNLLEPGDEVLSVSCGAFGDRFREIAARRGVDLHVLDVPWGEAVDPASVREALMARPGTKALLLTHNETSTGVVNPVEAILAALPEPRPLVLLDGVSSVGAMSCLPQAWGVDGLATSSQKGLMSPPGLSFLWLSSRGWEAARSHRCPTYSLDLVLYRKDLEKNSQTPYTPPLSLYAAVSAGLDGILREGAPAWFAARRRFARALASGLEGLGLPLLVTREEHRSPGVTALYFESPGVADSLRESLRSMGVEVAGGQGPLKGHLVRVAHYVDLGWPQLSLILGSFWAACRAQGKLPSPKEALERAYETWKEETPCGRSW